MASPVGNCPKCGAVITDEHQYSWCSKCGEPIPADLAARVPHVQALRAQTQVASTAAAKPPAPPETRVVITDINMRFSSMIIFMVKWAFAAIPAIIIIYLIIALILGLGLFSHR